MNLATVSTRALLGIRAIEVTVEVHLSNGLPALTIVGLPEAAVRESKDRVRAAILNSHFEFPARRITVNLAPAELPKQGGRYDLPIALGILAASNQVDGALLDEHVFVGELALTGALRAVDGCLPTALSLRHSGLSLVCPRQNRVEACLTGDVNVLPATDLLSVCNGRFEHPAEPECRDLPTRSGIPDMADVRGQHQARRAIEVAAAGRHNLLMVGPPGTGKSMLAGRLPGILPDMDVDEALETASVYSISHHGLSSNDWKRRPFRAPHHTASGVALVGGGSIPSPGEISLAHNGVLFLDELTEFDRRVLDVLREPLETGTICISRAARQAQFPARFQLVAAMNPCPQGYACDGRAMCECTAEQQKRHRARISAPLLDRIDMHVEVPKLEVSMIEERSTAEGSAEIRLRVCRAYDRQLARCGGSNATMGSREVEQHCRLARPELDMLASAMEKLGLSARAYHRILKLARTIADLADSGSIERTHLAEAIGYRSLDRFKS